MNVFDDEKFLSLISSCRFDENLLSMASARGDVEFLSKVYDFVHGPHFEVEKFPGMKHHIWSPSDDFSAMMCAVRSNNYEVVEFLCLMGRSKDLFLFDENGLTPFLICCKRCNIEIISYILYQNLFEIKVEDLRVKCPTPSFESYSYQNMIEQYDRAIAGYTPLHLFVQFGKLSIVESLCDFGADADIIVPANDLSTPLMSACRLGFFEIVKFLLRQNHELELMDEYLFVNMVDTNGQNAAFKACQNGSFKIFQLLFESSCSLKIKDKSGQSLFEYAIKQCHDSKNSMYDRFSIFKFMVRHGALVDIPVELLHSLSPVHKHPLTLAVEFDLSSVVCVLSSHLSESLIRQMFQIYLKRFPGSLKVIKFFTLRFFNSIDDNSWLFSILSTYLQAMVYQKCSVPFDFLCYDVFDIHPRLLFQNYFSEINFGESPIRSSFEIEAAVGIRLIELGCLHDKAGFIRTEQAMFIFKRLGLKIESFRSLIQDRISLMLIVEETFEKRLSDLSDDLSCSILHFAGIVDFIAIKYLKDFLFFYSDSYFIFGNKRRKRSRN